MIIGKLEITTNVWFKTSHNMTKSKDNKSNISFLVGTLPAEMFGGSACFMK